MTALPRVLCVDDSKDLADLVERLLVRSGFFESAGSVQEADELVSVVRERRADVVLLDLTMPGKDPLVACRELAEMEPGCCVVAFSARGDQESLDAATRAGARGMISKCQEPVVIVEALRAITGRERI